MQLALSLQNLVGSKKHKVKLSEKAADQAYRISKSASPQHQAVMIARAAYLMNSGRWKDGDETVNIVRTLESKATYHPQSWMVIAYYNGLIGNKEAAAKALVAGIKAGGELSEMQNVARSINMEIKQ